jgi:two-component system alkaline phosphatase synthesis response regulator PhoP
MNNSALILLVDDEPDFLKLYQKALTQAGFQVITAISGVEALKLAKEKKPSLILMDVKMPVMDGVEAAMKIREDPEIANLKIVFLTAFSDPNRPEVDVKAAKEMGALDFIKKGIPLTELVEKIKGYLVA